MRTEYRDIAVRRVRLGLLLSNIGDTNEITVTAEELNRAIMMEAQRFPGQERRVFEFYQKNPDAMQQVRAPIFEEKVMDFMLDKAEVTEKEVDRETLLSDPDEDAAAELQVTPGRRARQSGTGGQRRPLNLSCLFTIQFRGPSDGGWASRATRR